MVATPSKTQHFIKRLQALSRTRRLKRKDLASLTKSARPSAQSIRKRTFRPPKFMATIRAASLRYLGKPSQSRRNPFNTTPAASSSPRRRIIRVSKLNFAPPGEVSGDGVPTLRIRHPFEDFTASGISRSRSEDLDTPASQIVRDGRRSVESDSSAHSEAMAQTPPAAAEGAQAATPAQWNVAEILTTKASVYSLGSWAEINQHIDALWVSNSVLEGLEEELAASEDWSLSSRPGLPIPHDDLDAELVENQDSPDDIVIRKVVPELGF